MENKPGAGDNLGTDLVAKATPDGSTIGVSIGGPLAINTLLYARLPYDPRMDIATVTQLVTQPSVLAVNPALEVSLVADLIALPRKNPGKYNFASIGNGSLSHLAIEAIAIKAGAQLVHIPYPSSPQAITAVIRNDAADRLPSGDSGHAAGRNGSGEDSRRLYRETLALFAGPTHAEGKRDRCGSRCLERSHRTGRHAEANH